MHGKLIAVLAYAGLIAGTAARSMARSRLDANGTGFAALVGHGRCRRGDADLLTAIDAAFRRTAAAPRPANRGFLE
jgi:hypothetical protein